jgi:hypothetical protein
MAKISSSELLKSLLKIFSTAMKFRSLALNQLSPFDFETLVLQKEVFAHFGRSDVFDEARQESKKFTHRIGI